MKIKADKKDNKRRNGANSLNIKSQEPMPSEPVSWLDSLQLPPHLDRWNRQVGRGDVTELRGLRADGNAGGEREAWGLEAESCLLTHPQPASYWMVYIQKCSLYLSRHHFHGFCSPKYPVQHPVKRSDLLVQHVGLTPTLLKFWMVGFRHSQTVVWLNREKYNSINL